MENELYKSKSGQGVANLLCLQYITVPGTVPGTIRLSYWRACDDFFWVGGDKTQAKPESPPTQKKAELRIVRVRVPPSDGTEARGGSLGRARMCVCVCGTLACELEYEVCSGRRLLRMLGFCLRIVTYLWEITRIPLE